MQRLRVAVAFSILLSLLFVSESLLGNTPVTMAILQKCPGTFLS